MPTLLQNHHFLAAHDVRRSADLYVHMLGFENVAEPPGWSFVKKDHCMVMLGECPDDLPASELGCHSYFAYLRVDDADSYYADLETKGADLLSKIEDKLWQMRELGVPTPDGHPIMVEHGLAD